MNIILVELHDRPFGFPAEAVAQVLEPVPVTPLPFVDAHIEGLADLGGRVVPQIDLATLFGLPRPVSGGEVLMMQSPHGAYGLRVSRVQMMVSVAPDDFVTLGAGAGVEVADVPEDMVSGEFARDGRMVLVLDPDRLGIEDLAPHLDMQTATAGALIDNESRSETAAVIPALPPLLVVEIGAERYALPIETVRESLELDTAPVPVPKAPPEVAGLTPVRGQPLLLLSLARLLGLPADPQRGRLVVVVERAGQVIGLLVDRVLGLKSFAAEARVSFGDGMEADRGLLRECLLDADHRMVGELDLDRLIDEERLATLRGLMPNHHAGRTGDAEAEDPREDRHFLTFWLGQELCALDLGTVERVAPFAAPQPVPDSGHHGGATLVGMAEIGGDVMPVIDLREGHRGETGQSLAFVVARQAGRALALVVDRLNRIVAVPARDVRPSDQERRFAREIGKLNGTLFSVLALPALSGAAGDAA